MDHQIIVATHKYSRAIADLQYLSHTESFRDFADESWIAERKLKDYQEFWDNHLRNQQPREHTWIILANKQILGSISIISLENSSNHFRPSNQRTLADKDVACLRLMYIHPTYLRQGFGSQLINVAIPFMHENQYQLGVLITHAANSRARRFYEKNGWVLDRIFDDQVEEFFNDPPAMRLRARYQFPL